MKVYKRNGAEQDFCLDKIINAIKKANNAVSDDGKLTDEQFDKVVATVEKFLEPFDTVKVEDIQDLVEKALMKHNRYEIAKAYILFRDKKQNQKLYDDVDEQVLAITKGESAELRGDNANKHIDVNSSIRDYIAGTECKSLAQKMLDKSIITAHKKGWLHYHDMDYSPVMPLHNCDVFNIEDMLDNGFMMNDTKITRPRRFSTAANLAAQINLIISGSQYGGQTFSWAPLAKYVESTRVDCKIELLSILSVLPKWFAFILKPWYSKMVEVMVKRDIHVGIKTYQYQVLCHQSSNGQTPFVSNVINLREAMGEREQKDLAFIIEEILKRRTKGVLDKLGKPMPPLFPKLLYYTCDGLNVKKGDPYFYLTELAAKCITVRMQPDIISEKKNREVKKGQMIPCMGCRSFLAPIWEERRYPRSTKFYWQYVTSNNIQYEGAPGRNIDFNRKIEYSVLPHFDANCEIAINFRGNTGWLKEMTDEEVVVLQPIVYGRFNMGVVTINLPHCALSAVKSVKDNNMDSKYLKDEFYRILDERLEICHKALLTRWESVKNIKAKNSPILWQHGALARLNEEDTIGDWVMKHEPAFTSISLGYVGLYETCMALTGESNTSSKGQKTSSKILQYLNKKCEEWKEEDHLGYSIYGTPEEALTYKFASALAKDFGLIEHITDKEYVVNSYHVDPREDIDAFLKLNIEGQYLALSSGGAVSYIETPDMQRNPEAIISVIQYMHEHIMYAEVNTKLDTCYNCGYQGELKMIKTENGDFRFVCPVCGCDDPDKQLVTRRICGYMGVVNAGNVNKGRGDDIFNRTLHLDSESNIRYVGNMKPIPKSCLCS